MNNMRRGFTMIELIFVIVIIGILAAVAIPKLAATRDDAEASTCIHEVGQLIQEMSASYIKLGNAAYVASPISAITNIATNAGADDRLRKGIVEVGTTVLASGTAITYECDNVEVVSLTGTNSGLDFNLSAVTPAETGLSPAATQAVKGISKNLGVEPATAKIFKL
jgi:prepilin-type N-terminal cleavage/methylation domain-containing protein